MKPKIIKTKKQARAASIFFVLAIFISTLFLFLYKPPKAHAQIFLTSGTTWTVPSDWSNSNNSIEAIGGGGGGGGGFTDGSGSGGEGGGGGGAGAYAKAVNVTLSPGSTVAINIGAGGTAGATGATGVKGTAGASGSDTYLCNSTSNCSSITDSAVTVGAKGGTGGDAGAMSIVGAAGTGGAGAGGIGSTNRNGGNGGAGGVTSSGSGGGGGGGGGSAGPNAVGNAGTAGSALTGSAGGQGDGTSGGAGGATNGGTGGNGTEYDASHGSGGGGGGGNGVSRGSGNPGGNGGNYGGAGGGGGGNGSKQGNGGAGATGIQGMIRINYTFTSLNDYRWRLDDGNETTGTSLAAQDSAATINYGTNIRLRVSLSNVGSSTTFSYRLEYAPYVGSCGSWTPVPATATTEHFNIFNSSNITDQAATTNVSSGPGVLSDPSGSTFTAGVFVNNASNTATNQTIGAGQFTELEYAIRANANATYTSYCFRVTTSSGTQLDSYSNYPILNINYPPSTPTIRSVVNGSTNVSRLPLYQLSSSDFNNDYIRYVAEVCPTNSWPCASGGHTYDQTSAQTCWSGQDAQTATAYLGNSVLTSSTMAYCVTPTADILLPNTTYYWRAKATDPGGSALYSPYTSVASFTTGSLAINITGGASVTGGSIIGN